MPTLGRGVAVSTFDEYADRYDHVAMERRGGVIQLTLHSGGDSLRWGPVPHDELRQVFRDVGDDRENRVVILTGAGQEFTGPPCSEEERPLHFRPTPEEWDHFYWTGKQLQMNLLNIEVPMIAAVNGPAYRHMELAILCDIVLAAEHAVFVDSAHFEPGGLVPGDGVNVACMLTMGINRARYFHLTGQALSAREAKDFGLVNEVLAAEALLPRAWALAEQMARKPILQLRYSRVILTQHIKKQMQELVGYGLALEGLCISDPSSPF